MNDVCSCTAVKMNDVFKKPTKTKDYQRFRSVEFMHCTLASMTECTLKVLWQIQEEWTRRLNALDDSGEFALSVWHLSRNWTFERDPGFR